VSSPKESPTLTDRAPVVEPPQDWREELSERVEKFRQRRARLQPDVDSTGNLELDFGGLDKPAEHPFLGDTGRTREDRDLGFDKPEDRRPLDGVLATPEDRDSGFDLEIGGSAMTLGKDGALGETLAFEAPGEERMQLDANPLEAEEMSWGEPLAKSAPVEILVGSPTAAAPQEEEEGAEGIILAPLGHRFLAGLADAVLLFLGAGVFGVIFWRFCGRLSLVPLNIAVLGLVAVILVFAYFAVFAALTSATPGLLWMGCEIRNLRGGHPTLRESLWRAFGILVSLSALLLGFVWACVDSDRLTWHDRMSGTVITEERHSAGLAGLKAEN
jgi:uncharacterized RDD family membrane protein YckC